MKKLLLGSTALAGLLLTGAASAQQVTAKAPFTVTLNGDVRYMAVYNTSKQTDDGLENGLDARVVVSAAAKADNGLGYGFTGRFRNSGADSTFMDYKYLYLKGDSWGEVRLGDQYGVNGLVSAPSVFLIDGGYTLGGNSVISYGGPASGIATGLPQAYFHASWMNFDTLTGVQYATPVFGGFQVNVFYAPEYEWGRDLKRGISSTNGEPFAPYEDVLQLALRYKNTFGALGLDLSGGYGTADRVSSNFGSYEMWHVGGAVSFEGLTVGGHYQDLGNSFQPLSNKGYTDWNSWSLGATYGVGPWLAGLTYAKTNYDRPGVGVKGLDQSLWEVGGSYALAPGLALQGSVMWYDIDNAYAAAGTKGTTVAVRTRLQF